MRTYDNYQMLHEVLSTRQTGRLFQLARGIGNKAKKLSPGTNPKYAKQLLKAKELIRPFSKKITPSQRKSFELVSRVK